VIVWAPVGRLNLNVLSFSGIRKTVAARNSSALSGHDGVSEREGLPGHAITGAIPESIIALVAGRVVDPFPCFGDPQRANVEDQLKEERTWWVWDKSR
jgi:hypothetical protein